mmetsp:Transcript_17341/g.39591  ORF Transcript_17341/g.39591 Transcript_17341/m.39591 type:complete len:205 (-) Transcript_17341:217-831(-)
MAVPRAHLQAPGGVGVVARDDRGRPQDRPEVLHRDCRQGLGREEPSDARKQRQQQRLRPEDAGEVGPEERTGGCHRSRVDEPIGRDPQRAIQDRQGPRRNQRVLVEGAGVEVCRTGAWKEHDCGSPADRSHDFLHGRPDQGFQGTTARARGTTAAAATRAPPSPPPPAVNAVATIILDRFCFCFFCFRVDRANRSFRGCIIMIT